MFDGLLLHPKLRAQLKLALANTPHGLLLAGPAGSGKQTLSEYLAAQIMGIELDRVTSHPFVLIIDPDGESISIDEIRALQQFLKLKVPGELGGIRRTIIISRAERMRHEAQNALLKTLEEPPLDTVIIMTGQSAAVLLPTIVSRVTLIPLLPISSQQAVDYFGSTKSPGSIKQAYALSQGQAGLMYALLEQEAHPLLEQVNLAKQILSQPAKERLLLTDELAKDKPGVGLLLGAFQRITHAAITSAAAAQKPDVVKQWHAKQAAVLRSIETLKFNPNLKLLLDNLFLSI